MNSHIFHGETRHCRHLPRRHAFRYRMFWLGLDLDELSALDKSVAGFGYNRRALVSIRDADYAGPGTGSIRAKILHLLKHEGIEQPIGRITLLTIPRILGYVFNPISVYRCYRPDGMLLALVTEVHNTFGEAHFYVLRPRNSGENQAGTIRFRSPKAFYVSPFLDVTGEYELRLREQEKFFSLDIALRQQGQVVFSADMTGRGTPLGSRNLAATLGRLPLLAATVMLRIHAQAFQLFVRKRLPVFAKSKPGNAATITAGRPSFWHRLRTYIVNQASRKQVVPTNAPGLAGLKGRS